ncbi:MAG TPA: Calx-beta domain-containing protein [Thermoleophilaceae bacterium]|nr:Calx-beta domain-containing protein [Thermoleophilaceae bacterium]
MTKKILPLAALLAVALPGGTALAKGPKPKLQFSQSAYAVAENGGSATITVFRKGNAKRVNQAATVDYATSNGTAVAGVDYTATSGTVSFAPGELSETFSVPVTNKDTVDTGPRTITLRLSHPTATNGAMLGFPSSATLVISDDDTTPGSGPQFQLAEASDVVAEPTGASSTETVYVVRSGDLSSPTDVDYATADGGAIAGTDYTSASNTLHFPSQADDATGSIIQPVNVTLLHNPATSPATRDFSVGLSVPGGSTGVLGSPSSETVTIVNGDGAPTLQFSAPSYSVSETGGSARLTVIASGNIPSEVDVDYATADGSALAGVNYTAVSDTLQFVAGEGDIVESFDVPVMADGQLGDKSFTAALSNATGGGVIVDPSTATVTILNTDSAPAGGQTGGGSVAGSGSTGSGTPGTQEVLGARVTGCGLTVKASKKQRLLKQKGLKLQVRTTKACKISLSAVIKQLKSKKGARSAKALTFKGKNASLTLQPGKAKTVQVKFTKKTLAAIKKALLARKKLVATVVVTSKDSASKATRKTLRITIRR